MAKYDAIELRYMILNYVRDIEDGSLTSDIAVYIVSKEGIVIKERNIVAVIHGDTDKVIAQDIAERKKMDLSIYEADRLYVPNFLEDLKIYSAKQGNIIDSVFYEDITFRHYLGVCSGKAVILEIKGSNKKLIISDKKNLDNNNIISTFDTKLGLKITGFEKGFNPEDGVAIEYRDYKAVKASKISAVFDDGNKVRAKNIKSGNNEKRDSHIKSVTYNSTGNAIQEMQIKLLPKSSGGEYTVSLPQSIYTLGSKQGSVQISSIGGEDWKNRYNLDFRLAKLIMPKAISISGEIENLILSGSAIANNPRVIFDNGGQLRNLTLIVKDKTELNNLLEQLIMCAVQDSDAFSMIGSIAFITEQEKAVDMPVHEISELVKMQLSYYTNDYLKLKYIINNIDMPASPLKEKMLECKGEVLKVVKSLKQFTAKIKGADKLDDVRRLLDSREKTIEDGML